MLALVDREEGGGGGGGSRDWNPLFSETEKLRISVSKIRLKSVIFYLDLLFEWYLPPF